ncbi:MAG: hypothetical protein K0S81_1561 [Rhodospirillales bacterium]|nr:hypothetical protein [Rhodospirillales bacterium]
MADDAIDLDEHRGMMAQRATDIRRRRSGYEAVQATLRQQQEQLEEFLLAAPSATWPEVAEKAAYLLTQFAASTEARDPRRQQLISNVLDDFRRLSGELSDPDNPSD